MNKKAGNKVISDSKELQKFQAFLAKKIEELTPELDPSEDEDFEPTPPSRRESIVSSPSDVLNTIFMKAVSKYSQDLELIRTNYGKKGFPKKTYNDIISDFAQVLESSYGKTLFGNYFSKDVGVNAFRGIIDEFQKKIDRSMSEKYTQKILNTLSFSSGKTESHPSLKSETLSKEIKDAKSGTLKAYKGSRVSSFRKIFGVEINSLKPKIGILPPFVETLFTSIEMFGATEGELYRQTCDPLEVDKLQRHFEEAEEEIIWNTLSVHVLTNLLLRFFSELPEPLLTYELYSKFIRASSLEEPEDRSYIISTIMARLPTLNYCLAERLLKHLDKISNFDKGLSKRELSEIWGPIVLRREGTDDLTDDGLDAKLIVICLQTILEDMRERFRRDSNISTLSLSNRFKRNDKDRESSISLSSRKDKKEKNADIESIIDSESDNNYNRVEFTDFNLDESAFEELKMDAIEGLYLRNPPPLSAAAYDENSNIKSDF